MRRAIICALMTLTVTAATAAEDKNSANYMLPACKRFGTGSNEPPFWGAFDQGECIGTVKTIAFFAENADISVTALSGVGQVTALRVEKQARRVEVGRHLAPCPPGHRDR
jgi:hypothetical protein